MICRCNHHNWISIIKCYLKIIKYITNYQFVHQKWTKFNCEQKDKLNSKILTDCYETNRAETCDHIHQMWRCAHWWQFPWLEKTTKIRALSAGLRIQMSSCVSYKSSDRKVRMRLTLTVQVVVSLFTEITTLKSSFLFHFPFWLKMMFTERYDINCWLVKRKITTSPEPKTANANTMSDFIMKTKWQYCLIFWANSKH